MHVLRPVDLAGALDICIRGQGLPYEAQETLFTFGVSFNRLNDEAMGRAARLTGKCRDLRLQFRRKLDGRGVRGDRCIPVIFTRWH